MTERYTSADGMSAVALSVWHACSGRRAARQERRSWNDPSMLREARGTSFGLEVP
ncbi:hypothetical protein STRIP9103_08957 [Streptomyces ipomoeae 91-03]|uniref:Uncharacterized protein n=1 Tax=Streptomyces ipomoeae 91-03 TaxID=698759 RepID=L1KW15_9ACTN|nr:hypothetical protein STRIP9103_08957 [Streptomyces ipomoeae 91-03]